MPRFFGASGSVRTRNSPTSAIWPKRAPDLLAVQHVVVAVALGPRAQRREIGAGAGLGEALAPHLVAAQDPRQVRRPSAASVPSSMRVGPGVQGADEVARRRTAPGRGPSPRRRSAARSARRRGRRTPSASADPRSRRRTGAVANRCPTCVVRATRRAAVAARAREVPRRATHAGRHETIRRRPSSAAPRSGQSTSGQGRRIPESPLSRISAPSELARSCANGRGAAEDHQRRRPRRRAGARVEDVAAGEVPRRRPAGRAPGHRRSCAHRRRRLRADVRRRRPRGRLLGLRGPRLHQQAPRRRGRASPATR